MQFRYETGFCNHLFIMRVTVRHKNFKMTPALKEYIGKKITAPAEKFLKSAAAGGLPLLDIEISRTTRHHRKGRVYMVAATLALGKKTIRAQVLDEDPYAACDLLEDELKREIQTHKTKSLALFKRGARKTKKDLHLAPAARLFRKGRIRNEGN